MLHVMSVLILLHILLYCDNKSVISIAINFVLHERTKVIEDDCHMTRVEYTAKKIVFAYIPSKE